MAGQEQREPDPWLALAVRIAKALNKVWNRKGTVFARRYYPRPVVGPRQIRNLIRYVLLNRKPHGSRLDAVDPYSSGRWFNGWSTPPQPCAQALVTTPATATMARHPLPGEPSPLP